MPHAAWMFATSMSGVQPTWISTFMPKASHRCAVFRKPENPPFQEGSLRMMSTASRWMKSAALKYMPAAHSQAATGMSRV